jgi:dephospho-CoA kinase
MKVIGLTGGIASGKSTAARLLEELGAPVIDADLLAREAVRPGSDSLGAIVARFGNRLLQADGSLDRAALGRMVFALPEARKELEGIIHPEVRRLARLALQGLKESGAPVVFYMAPLLMEAGADTLCDEIWVVDLDEASQLQRITARDGMAPDEARLRMAAQMPLAEKAARGDLVVNNRGTVEELAAQLKELWELRLRSTAASGEVIKTQ